MHQTPGLAAQRHAQLKHTLKHELLKMEWDLVRLQAELLQIQLASIKRKYLQNAKHNPNWHSQPRVPAGNADGGQWTDGGGGGNPTRDNTPKPTRKPEPNRTIHDPPIEPVYPIESIIAFLLPARTILAEAWQAFALLRLRNRDAVSWRLGDFKSPKRWTNQIRDRNWTPEQITRTIKKGERYHVENHVHKNNPALQYHDHTTGRFVVIDDVTKEILQISDRGFLLNHRIK